MLPSKGYFKSLNCPYFEESNCNRPHCHFRHTRKDRAEDEIEQIDNSEEQATEINDFLSHIVLEENNSDNSWAATTHSTSSSISYKPTPIIELKKRHIPITTAPSITLSTSSQKRRLEYDVKVVKKPKMEYIPEAANSWLLESSSNSIYTQNIESSYKATKISDQVINGADDNENIFLQDTEESEDDIDFDQVSNELNFLDEILQKYGNSDTNEGVETIQNLDNLSKVHNLSTGHKEKGDVSKVCNEVVKNGFQEHCNSVSGNDGLGSDLCELDHSSAIDIKKHKVLKHNVESSKTDSKNKVVNSCTDITEKSQQISSSKTTSSNKSEQNSVSSSHRRKSNDHNNSEKDKHMRKDGSETLTGSSKSTKINSRNECATDKLIKNVHNSTSSSKNLKRDHSSTSNKSSKKEPEHKSSSNKSSRKDSEQASSSSKSSKHDSNHKSNSGKSSKKEEGQSKSSTSSKSESGRKTTHSTESHISNSKKYKEGSKQSDKSRKSSSIKYKDRSKHRKESNERRSTKEVASHKSKEDKSKEKRDKKEISTKRIHSVSELDQSSDDDVEIISDPVSIIVIDSEEEANSETSRSNEIMNVQIIESSPSPPHSPGIPSPMFPSDVSDASDKEDNLEDRNTQLITNSPSGNPKKQDEAALLDHRVKSRIKTRVSLGTTWRPPPKKPVEIMTPAQRLLFFAKHKDTEEKDTRIKIGSVPNVKLLLEEKERLLKGNTKSNNNLLSAKRKPPTSLRTEVTAHISQEEDKDEAPKLTQKTPHPHRAGADIYTRQSFIEKLYSIERQLVMPGKLYKCAQQKCIESELRIWEETNHATYEKAMRDLIERQRSEIPKFTIKYYTQIKPRPSTLFPEQLKIQKKTEGDDQTGTTTDRGSLYNALLKYQMTDEQLTAEGYPRKKDVSVDGKIIAHINKESLNKWKKPQAAPPTNELACANCHKFYSVNEIGLSTDPRGCQYHAKSSWNWSRQRGERIKLYRCCNSTLENYCMSANHHATETRDMENLEGFVETKEPDSSITAPKEGWGIFALDCEMYWSTRGLELGRVTVVNSENRIVYDTFVKPEFPVADFCTRMSGITKEDLKNALKSFNDVQTDLLKLFNSKSILIGHSLENDLKVLQIIHNLVVDTSIVFQSGDRKVALKVLASQVLNEVIQNEEEGHDSAEDAITCIKLMKRKIFQDVKEHIKKVPVRRYGNRQRIIDFS